MTEIIPAIMPQNFEEIEVSVKKIVGLVSTVQIDIMDGFFVPEKNWPYTQDGENDFQKLVSGEKGLPQRNDINYEIDLMVDDPMEVVEKWFDTGAMRVIVHFESALEIEDLITQFGKNMIANNPRQTGFLKNKELGLALNIATPNENIYPYVERFDFVQFMGIARIGYQGQSFDDRVIPKIKDLRKSFPGVIISVDGGVNFDSAPKLVEVGANRLISGSTIFNASNIKQSIEQLEKV